MEVENIEGLRIKGFVFLSIKWNTLLNKNVYKREQNMFDYITESDKWVEVKSCIWFFVLIFDCYWCKLPGNKFEIGAKLFYFQ